MQLVLVKTKERNFSDFAGLLTAKPARPASNQVIKCAGKGTS